MATIISCLTCSNSLLTGPLAAALVSYNEFFLQHQNRAFKNVNRITSLVCLKATQKFLNAVIIIYYHFLNWKESVLTSSNLSNYQLVRKSNRGNRKTVEHKTFTIEIQMPINNWTHWWSKKSFDNKTFPLLFSYYWQIVCKGAFSYPVRNIF